MTSDPKTTNGLLNSVYEQLGFVEGDLLSATQDPREVTFDQWVEKGEWLSVASRAKVERVFFVDNNPVIVFAEYGGDETGSEDNPQDSNSYQSLCTFFNKIWCMARPQLLFLAQHGELAIYDLTKPPVRPGEKLSDSRRRLGIVKTAAEIQSKLQEYNRAQIESGRLFEEKHFGKPTDRADESLIRDLKVVRNKLTGAGGLKKEYAHRLIGRSIFIRYLEDREILVPKFFQEVAEGHANWESILAGSPEKLDIDPEMEKKNYIKVLSNKAFTYALFDKLAETFNGDIFPIDSKEKKAVTETHLHWLQKFFRGDVEDQEKLFFFAYKFDIIPIELISSIYEEFYNDESGKDTNQGSHYTRSTLVEFLLTQTLTEEQLEKQPCITDPTCGSGIFLVEAFRRIVRYEVKKRNGEPLKREDLRAILKNQIRGIDINNEAIRIAAFSLYLALMHYQQPRDIRQNPKLPHLKYTRPKREDREYFDILLAQNACDFETLLSGVEEDVRCKFSSRSADIVIGNPPWGFPKKKDRKGLEAAQTVLAWCENPSIPPVKHVGDNELSQAFIHKTIDLLRDGGIAGLLVSSGVFFKRQSESCKFRRQWLTSTTIKHVVNFAHVRHIFFSGEGRNTKAIAPFASVIFTKSKPQENSVVQYWSAKRTAFIKRAKSVVLSRSDLNLIPQVDLLNDDTLWKIYWWGNHRDQALIQTLRLNPHLEEITNDKGSLIQLSGRGLMKGTPSESQPTIKWPKNFKECPTDKLKRYGVIKSTDFRKPPSKAERERSLELFEGLRLLIKQTPSEESGRKGQIIARLESEPFCFRHSIYSFRLQDSITWEAKILLGILWSSLAKYYFYMTTSQWGLWFDKISLDEVRNLPVRLPADRGLRNRIVKIVDELRSQESAVKFKSNSPLLFPELGYNRQRDLEDNLDEAVFDLYNLTEAERDLIRDLCEVGLDLYYNNTDSSALQPLNNGLPPKDYGLFQDIPTNNHQRDSLGGYLQAFLRIWNHEISPEGEFRWQVIRDWQVVRPGKNPPMIAVVFSTQYKEMPLPPPDKSDEQEWTEILEKISQSTLHFYGSRGVYIDGLIRCVADPEIIIIKRNQQRLWTPSQAREDAEATLLQAMLLQEGSRSKAVAKSIDR